MSIRTWASYRRSYTKFAMKYKIVHSVILTIKIHRIFRWFIIREWNKNGIRMEYLANVHQRLKMSLQGLSRVRVEAHTSKALHNTDVYTLHQRIY